MYIYIYIYIYIRSHFVAQGFRLKPGAQHQESGSTPTDRTQVGSGDSGPAPGDVLQAYIYIHP